LNKDKDKCGNDQLIEKKYLYCKNEIYNKSLVEDNKCILGIYIRVFKG